MEFNSRYSFYSNNQITPSLFLIVFLTFEHEIEISEEDDCGEHQTDGESTIISSSCVRLITTIATHAIFLPGTHSDLLPMEIQGSHEYFWARFWALAVVIGVYTHVFDSDWLRPKPRWSQNKRPIFRLHGSALSHCPPPFILPFSRLLVSLG